MKLFDKIQRYLRSKGLILRNPVKQKKSFAKPGSCKFIDSTETEALQALNEQAEERDKENELPHPL